MIVIYPMLTSESVSPNVLPGLVKAVEKYILLYHTDEILKMASSSTAGKILSTGAKIVAGTAITAAAGAVAAKMVDKILDSDDLTEAPGGYSTTKTVKITNKQSGEEAQTSKTSNIPLSGGGGHGSSVRPSLDIPRNDAVSLEPTWLNVTTEKKGMQILGVKVVPFSVRGGQSMASLLFNDTQLKHLTYLSTKYGRAFTRVFFRLMRKVRLPVIKDKALSGDPKKDIIYGGTQYGKNMFVCLSKLDIDNEETFDRPSSVQRLHKLGWASFIVADDVNKRATFCMKEFGGVCSVIPYGYMFSSLGKEHSKVYEDLEDLKKASGPFFNRKTNRRRTFSESKSVTEKYLEMLQK